MTDREALAAALGDSLFDHVQGLTISVSQEFGDDPMDDVWLERARIVETAARERLAQMEGVECPRCGFVLGEYELTLEAKSV